MKTATNPAPAAPASTKPVKLEKFTGDIKSVDAMAKSIVVAKTQEEKTFGVTGDTEITKGKETLKFEDLKAGMNAVVESKKDGEKRWANFTWQAKEFSLICRFDVPKILGNGWLCWLFREEGKSVLGFTLNKKNLT